MRERVRIIDPARREPLFDWAEFWQHRDVLYYLAWRDIRVRYKQTSLGVLWAVLQPFLAMLVFAVFFGRLAGLDSRTGSVPYALYVFTGLLPWILFSTSVTAGGVSLVASANLIGKVYFPRILVPMASVAVAFADFAVSLLLLAFLMAYFGVVPSSSLLLAPVFVLAVVLGSSGIGAFFAAVTVEYRDFRHALPFLVQLWLYLTPVAYPAALVPTQWRWVLSLNPIAGAIEGFRCALLAQPFQWADVSISLSMCALLFLMGCAYFRRVERNLADIV